jgi:hypothetical protein
MLMAEAKKLARSFVATDLVDLARRLRERGIQPNVLDPDDVIEDDPHSVIQLIIGHRGNLTGRQAKEAAKRWKLARSQAPRSPVHVTIAGYDQDPRALWEFAEVCRFVRRWARGAGLADPYVAMREIGASPREPSQPRGNAHKRPLPAIENVAAVYRDQQKIILVRRDAPRIAGSFDEYLGSRSTMSRAKTSAST